MRRATLARALVGCALAAGAVLPTAAQADRYETGFEGPSFALGALQGQDGWTNGGPTLDASVAPAAGGQAFRMSNAVVSGAINQVRTRRLAESAGETNAGAHHARFETSVSFTSADPAKPSTGCRTRRSRPASAVTRGTRCGSRSSSPTGRPTTSCGSTSTVR